VLATLSEQPAAVALEVADQLTPLDQSWRGARFADMLPLRGSHAVSTPPQLPSIELTIAYEPVEDGWVQARIVELPAVITAGRTREDAKALVLDALREYLMSLRDEAADGDGEREPVALTITA
jgi:predicted RNase H-like HicB family nuclease